MKIQYQRPKGRRIKRFGFLGVTVMTGTTMFRAVIVSRTT